MQHQGFPRALARYLNRNETFILVAGIVVVLVLVVALALISRTSLRTTPSTMCGVYQRHRPGLISVASFSLIFNYFLNRSSPLLGLAMLLVHFCCRQTPASAIM